MSLTRADILTRAKDVLDDSGDQLLSDAKCYRAFNEAQRQWAKDTLCLSTQLSLNVVAGTGGYALSAISSRVFELVRVRYRETISSWWRDLSRVNLSDLTADYTDTNRTGIPTRYALSDNATLTLWPIPSLTTAGGVSIDAVMIPADLSESADDTTPLSFPDTHREGLLWGLVRELCVRGANDPTLLARLEYAQGRYDEEVARHVRTLWEGGGRMNSKLASPADREGEFYFDGMSVR